MESSQRFFSGVQQLKVGTAWLVVVAWLCTPMHLGAQGASTIQGQISDSTGAAVGGATVKVTNETTGVTRTTVSATDGYYRIPDLLPGPYEVRSQMAGFKTFVRNKLSLSSGATIGLNIALDVGDVTESVNVTAEDRQVETQVARISEVIPEQEVHDLPTQGHGILNLVALSPGMTGIPNQPGNITTCCDAFSAWGAPYISAGGKEQKSQFFLDGINLRYTEGSGWGAAFSPNIDAVQEIRVTTEPDSADLGRMSGPVIQMVTKGGTNELHGSGQYTFQPSATLARPFFQGTSPVPDSHYRLFGGTIGGPIIKNRLFVFGSYQGLRSVVANAPYTDLVETQQFVSYVEQMRPNSIAAQILKAAPPVQYATTGLVDVGSLLPGHGVSATPAGIPEFGTIQVNDPAVRTGNQINSRVDYDLPNGRDRIFANYWYTQSNAGTDSTRAAYNSTYPITANSGTVGYTHTFSPNILNEARFGAIDVYDTSSYPKKNIIANIPYDIVDDGFTGSGFYYPSYYNSRSYQISDALSINRGKHSIKLGAEYDYGSMTAQWPNYPSYEFTNILSFADDDPYAQYAAVDAQTGASNPITHLPMISGDTSVFMQNTWQIRRNLTLNYGLRWETYTPIHIGGRPMWNPILSESGATDPAAIAGASSQKVGQLYKRDWHNFGPRLGLSWDPTGQGKMAIHLGFAVLYDEVNTDALYHIYNNPPTLAYLTAGPQFGIPLNYALAPPGTSDFPANPALEAPAVTPQGGIAGTRVNLAGVVNNLHAPRILNFMFGYQYQIHNDMMAQFDCKHRRATQELYNENDINMFAGDKIINNGVLTRLNQNFGKVELLTNLGERFYYGCTANLAKRLSHGYTVSASYTYNYGTNNFGAVASGFSDHYYPNPTSSTNPQLDYSRDDIPHVFRLHGTWELPFLRSNSSWTGRVLGGWQINSILSFQSGAIFTPLLVGQAGDTLGSGVTWGGRPDRPTANPSSSFDNSQWLAVPLQASMFPVPLPGTVGTLPRDRFRYPGYSNVDLSLFKEFSLALHRLEKGRVELRAEAFNAFNHLNIRGIGSGVNTSVFAQPLSAYQNRVMQFSAKYTF